MLDRPAVQQLLERVSPLVQVEELKAATAAGSLLSPELLRKVLTVELLLADAPVPSMAESSAEVAPWSKTVGRGRTKPVADVTLETLTEFDPRKHYYHDGEWVDTDPQATDAAFHALLLRRAKQVLERPYATSPPPQTLETPPGSPIGQHPQ